MSPKPVILQVIPQLETGGAERTVIEVAEAIVAAGGKALVASEGGRLEGELAAVGGTLIRLPMSAKNPLTILAHARKLQGIIAERGVSLVHARSRAPAWSALIAARRAKVPFVTTYHGIYNQKGRVKSWYNSVMARGDLVIANSHYTAGIVKARHGTPDERLRVIPRGVDLARFSPDTLPNDRIAALRSQWGVADDDARLVVLAARLTRWKGQITVIDAAAYLLKNPDFTDVVFILAGDDQGRSGYKEELTERISRHGLTDRILMPGHCADMPAAFAAADLALVSSIEPEAFGRISIEAQAMGCPVILSEIGALPETLIAASNGVLETNATGWTFPPGNADALAARISAALRREAGEEAVMAEAARKHVAESFSKQALQYRTLKVYDDLLDSRLAPGFDRKSSRNVVSRSWLHRIPT